MKVRIDLDKKNDPDIVEIHVDHRLTRETIRWWDSPKSSEDFPTKERKPKYVKSIFQIPGVESISIEQHSVMIEKGSTFSWDKILPAALKEIKKVLDPKGKIIRLKPLKHKLRQSSGVGEGRMPRIEPHIM